MAEKQIPTSGRISIGDAARAVGFNIYEADGTMKQGAAYLTAVAYEIGKRLKAERQETAGDTNSGETD